MAKCTKADRGNARFSRSRPLTTADFCAILYREDKSREHTVQRGIGWCKISGDARGYHLAEENGGSRDGSYKCYTNEVKARVEPCGFFRTPDKRMNRRRHRASVCRVHFCSQANFTEVSRMFTVTFPEKQVSFDAPLSVYDAAREA